MEQQIILERWDKLSDEQKFTYVTAVFKEIKTKEDYKGFEWLEGKEPDIGQIMEFLGKDLLEVQNVGLINKWIVGLHIGGGDIKDFTNVEPVYALWEAAEYKLNNL